MNFEQNQSGLVVWLKCATDYNCSDHQGRGMKRKTATADYGKIPSATHSWLLRLCTFNQFLSKTKIKNESIKQPRQQSARSCCVFTEDHNVSSTKNIKTLFYSLKIKLCLGCSVSQAFTRLSQGNIQRFFNRFGLFTTNGLFSLWSRNRQERSWREVSRKRGSHCLILDIVLQNTTETMLVSFNYLSVHYTTKGNS